MGNFDPSHVQKCPSDIMSKLNTIYIALNTNLCSYIRERELCIALNTIYIIFVVIYKRESSA